MKLSWIAGVSLLAMGFSLSFCTASFADNPEGVKEAAAKDQADTIKHFEDAAVVLQTSQPDLAAELTRISSEMKNDPGGKKTMEGMTPEEIKMRRQARLAVVRTAADVLQTSNPALSAALTKVADQHDKKKAGKEAEKKSEKGVEKKNPSK